MMPEKIFSSGLFLLSVFEVDFCSFRLGFARSKQDRDIIFLDAQNGTGTMEFSIHGIPDDFFPVQVIKKISYQIKKR